MNFANQIISSVLHPDLKIQEVEKLCKDAVELGISKVCVPPLFVKKTKSLLADSPIKVSTVIGFPFGYSAVEAKVAEIILAILDGADELDVVINIAALKNNDWQYLAQELSAILPVIQNKQKLIKIILETGLLEEEEMIKCCDLYGIAGVNYIVTSTGFSPRGATRETVKLLRKHLAEAIGIVASGNSIDKQFAKDLLDDGAIWISTSNPLSLVKDK